MATYTQTQVIERALVELGVQDPEEGVPAERLAFGEDSLTALLADLQAERLTDWDISGAVPDDRYTPLWNALAGHMASAYGVAMQLDRSGRTVAEERARLQLRDAIYGPYVAPEWDRFRDF